MNQLAHESAMLLQRADMELQVRDRMTVNEIKDAIETLPVVEAVNIIYQLAQACCWRIHPSWMPEAPAEDE